MASENRKYVPQPLEVELVDLEEPSADAVKGGSSLVAPTTLPAARGVTTRPSGGLPPDRAVQSPFGDASGHFD